MRIIHKHYPLATYLFTQCSRCFLELITFKYAIKKKLFCKSISVINCFTCLERGKLLFKQGEIDLKERNGKGEKIPKSQQDRMTQNLYKRRKHIMDTVRRERETPQKTREIKDRFGPCKLQRENNKAERNILNKSDVENAQQCLPGCSSNICSHKMRLSMTFSQFSPCSAQRGDKNRGGTLKSLRLLVEVGAQRGCRGCSGRKGARG